MVIACLLLGYGIGNFTASDKETLTPKHTITRPIDKEVTSMEDFIDFLESGYSSIGNIDRKKTLGRYLRLIRYQDDMRKVTEEYGIPYDCFFGLAMVE